MGREVERASGESQGGLSMLVISYSYSSRTGIREASKWMLLAGGAPAVSLGWIAQRLQLGHRSREQQRSRIEW